MVADLKGQARSLARSARPGTSHLGAVDQQRARLECSLRADGARCVRRLGQRRSSAPLRLHSRLGERRHSHHVERTVRRRRTASAWRTRCARAISAAGSSRRRFSSPFTTAPVAPFLPTVSPESFATKPATRSASATRTIRARRCIRSRRVANITAADRATLKLLYEFPPGVVH